MKKRWGMMAGALLAGMAGTAQAALLDRGYWNAGGHYSATQQTGYVRMVYDTHENLTWIGDTKFAMTLGDDDDGAMTWGDAKAWADQLVFGGYSNWRLPTTVPPVSGYNQTGSEMGHLFYTELGMVASQTLLSTHNSNFDLFSYFGDRFYWSGTEISSNSAWGFNAGNGSQGTSSKDDQYRALAVRAGDVAPVPLPGALWLFASALLGLTGAARRRLVLG